MVESKTIKATLTMGEDKKLTLRLFLNDTIKEQYILEKGTQPVGMIKLVVM